MNHSITSFIKKSSVALVLGCALFTGIASATNVYQEDINDHIVNTLIGGDIAKITELLQNEIEINQEIANDGTPLIIAVQNNDIALVKFLIERGADVNKASLQDGNPLINAALNNNIALLEYLHLQGAALNNIVEHDETALISASRAGYFAAVKFLVEQGADVNLAVEITNIFGEQEVRSPLNGAKTKAIADFLIANGAKSVS